MLPEEKLVIEAAIAFVQNYKGDHKILNELDLVNAVDTLLAAYHQRGSMGGV